MTIIETIIDYQFRLKKPSKVMKTKHENES